MLQKVFKFKAKPMTLVINIKTNMKTQGSILLIDCVFSLLIQNKSYSVKKTSTIRVYCTCIEYKTHLLYDSFH